MSDAAFHFVESVIPVVRVRHRTCTLARRLRARQSAPAGAGGLSVGPSREGEGEEVSDEEEGEDKGTQAEQLKASVTNRLVRVPR